MNASKPLRYAGAFLACNILRLFRFFPNNDPIMAFVLPFSRQDKWLYSAFFAFTTMVVFDYFTSGIGIWTFTTAITYTVIAIAAGFYFRGRKKVGMKAYLGTGIAGILFFDFVTGVLFGPTLFGVPLQAAFLGQIPFTLLHIASASAYIALIVPFLDKQASILPIDVADKTREMIGLLGALPKKIPFLFQKK
ncbi:MAG: hypothetical protein HY392_00990 [Candidatus Diapherotrites archaeon]|nr:hypothetical protein [Candidatus Diapherotrites archaeon]